VAVRETAFIGVLGEQVPSLNLEAFADAEWHEGNDHKYTIVAGGVDAAFNRSNDSFPADTHLS
jgi:hypothetical protein